VKATKRIALAGSVLVLLATAGGLALAAGRAVTVQVVGGYGARYANVCGKVHKHYDLYHRTAKIEADGTVTPAPTTKYTVRLEIKKCVKGVFVKIGDRFTTGQAGSSSFVGTFRAGPIAPSSHKAGAIVYERVRAILGGSRSEYDYFAITN
jgi:hypothetical protein